MEDFYRAPVVTKSQEAEAKVILFLGAGASKAKPLELPTTKDFLNQFRSKIGREQSFEASLLNGLLRIPEVKDIEHVLEKLRVLESASEDLSKMLDYQPEHVSYSIHNQSIKLAQLPAYCKRLEDKIYDELFELYYLIASQEKREEIAKLYTPLFNLILECNKSELPIFTTNYDTAIEEFQQSKSGSDFGLSFGFDNSMPNPKWTGISENAISQP